MRFVLVCLLGVLALSSSLEADVRTWTDSSGKYEIKAEFVSLINGKVTLKREDGEEKTLPLSKLSDADQQIAKDFARKQSSLDDEKSGRRNSGFINSVRAAPMRTLSSNNMRQIAMALINYESTNGRFPTSATGRGSKPGLSWRVAILPYLEENNLYRRFRQNEPWDSPHNKQLIERMPKVFASPGSSAEQGWTNYLAVLGDDSIIVDAKKGKGIRDIRDGTSRTLIIVEANDSEAAIWTKPDDYVWDRENPTAGLGGIWPGQFFGAFADGTVQRINLAAGDETVNAMFTRSGMERYTLE